MILLSETPAGRFEFDPIKHEYFLDGKRMPSWSEIGTHEGLIDYESVPQGNRQRGMGRGQDVHEMLHFFDEDDLDERSVSEDLRGFFDAYRLFKSDTEFKPDLIEKGVFNIPFWYAGTLDRRGRGKFFGERRRAILDLKTGKIERWTGIQLSAYSLALNDPEPLDRYGVQLSANGKYKLVPFFDPQDVQVWKSAVTLFHFKRRAATWRP